VGRLVLVLSAAGYYLASDAPSMSSASFISRDSANSPDTLSWGLVRLPCSSVHQDAFLSHGQIFWLRLSQTQFGAGFGISYNVLRVYEARKGLGERKQAAYPLLSAVRLEL